MKIFTNKRDGPSCLAMMDRHWPLLAINAIVLFGTCIYSLQKGTFETAGTQMVLTTAGFIKVWLQSLLLLTGILLAGFLPGSSFRIVILAVFGNRFLAPTLSVLLAGGSNYKFSITLFFKFFALLMVGTLAEDAGMQAGTCWDKVFGALFDFDAVNEHSVKKVLFCSESKVLTRKIIGWFLCIVIPLSVMVTLGYVQNW